MQLPAQQLHDLRAAEAALTPAHTGPHTALDAVQRPCARHAADGVPYLALGDALAPADDLTVGRVAGDEILPGREVHLAGMGHIPALGDEILLFRRVELRRRQLRQIPANGRGGGQAGGLDAHRLEEAVGALAHDEVVLRAAEVRPKSGKAGDHVPHGQVLHALGRRLRHGAQPLRRGGGAILVRLIHGGRPNQQVAVYRGRDQHTLAHGGGQLEDGVLHQLAAGAVQQTVFTPPGHDGQLVRA